MDKLGGNIYTASSFVADALITWIWIATLVKRCHDQDLSGWYVLIAGIPFFGQLWILIGMGMLPGTEGPNKYGEKARSILENKNQIETKNSSDLPEKAVVAGAFIIGILRTIIGILQGAASLVIVLGLLMVSSNLIWSGIVWFIVFCVLQLFLLGILFLISKTIKENVEPEKYSEEIGHTFEPEKQIDLKNRTFLRRKEKNRTAIKIIGVFIAVIFLIIFSIFAPLNSDRLTGNSISSQVESSKLPNPTSTIKPITRVEETRRIPTLKSTGTAIVDNSLRLNTFALRENTYTVFDTNAQEKYREIADYHARNLAIAKPYHWDYYLMNKDVIWDDVNEHYKKFAALRDYVVRRDEFNSEINMGLLTFGKGNANIYVQFWANDPCVIVFYKNVED